MAFSVLGLSVAGNLDCEAPVKQEGEHLDNLIELAWTAVVTPLDLRKASSPPVPIFVVCWSIVTLLKESSFLDSPTISCKGQFLKSGNSLLVRLVRPVDL